MKELKIEGSKYYSIAADFAFRIVENKYKVGDKLSARSTIAAQYGVSSETARRAINILSDLDIVEIKKNSGIIIKSYENALKFTNQFKDIQTLDEIKNDLNASVERQKKELTDFNKSLNKLINQTNRFRYLNPLSPYELEITKDMPHLNRSIGELNFWQNTGATIVAIKRNNIFIISPGPYATLNEHDIIYFVGNETALQKVENFLVDGNNI